MEYCDFPAGKYRALVTSSYLDTFKTLQSVDSNYFYFESTQPAEEILIKCADIAIAHQYYCRKDANVIWICFIDDNDVLQVKYSQDNIPYFWHTYHIPYIIADQCSICFDSRLENNESNIAEFITDEFPYICYTRNNALYLLDLISGESSLIASENVVDVSVVRGPISLDYAKDFGFIIFFLMENKVYYKQKIGNIWYDAEIVSVGNLPDVTFTRIETFRTWDFRVGVQLINTDGELYQIISYFEGLSNLNNENIRMGLQAEISLLGINYHDTKTADEHINMGISLTKCEMIYGHSSMPISITNIEDADQNWGTTIQITFDYPNTVNNLQTTSFTLIDTNTNNFICRSASLSQDGLALTLVFDDFNATYRATNTTLTYTVPSTGGLISPAGQQTTGFALTFVPQNLIDPGPPPVVDIITNNATGEEIYVTFDKVLTNTTFDSDIISHFTVSVEEYNYVPDGTIITTSRVITNIVYGNSMDTLVFTLKQNISAAVGNVTITYDGTGGLRGIGGPIGSFAESFVPTGLTWKGNTIVSDHISMGLSSNIQLTSIEYHNTKTEENIGMGLTASIVLTDVHDL